jgi:hypothetical protein
MFHVHCCGPNFIDGTDMKPTRPPLSRVAVASLAFSLVACGSLHATYVPDGRRGFVVTCGGFLNSWSTCLVKAGRACGSHGYETLKGSEEDRSMLIACRVPGIAGLPDGDPTKH